MLIFTYGTLMRGFGNNRILQAKSWGVDMADKIKPATFVGEAVTAGRFSMKDIGFPYIRRGRQAKAEHKPVPVVGELWDIGDPNNDPAAKLMLEMLDRLEGVAGGHYDRVTHICYIGGDRSKPVSANLYHATTKTWERVQWAPDVPDCNWGERNKERRKDETRKAG